MSWVLVWKVVVVLTLAGFSLLAIMVLVGGVGNIAEMLKELGRPRRST
ncbi:MAG: hypothetical protein ACUVTG_02730 [Candidatus Oleimicrobiaceae bacterium]